MSNMSYSNNGDGTHTAYLGGWRVGKVSRVGSGPWTARRDARRAGGFGSMSEAGEQLAAWVTEERAERKLS